jgi:hypothetical protein
MAKFQVSLQDEQNGMSEYTKTLKMRSFAGFWCCLVSLPVELQGVELMPQLAPFSDFLVNWPC